VRWLRPGPYSTLVLLVFLALLSVAFAWMTFDLARLAMANSDFLWREGFTTAIMYGGHWQTLGIVAKGVGALFCYLGFKGIERELMTRWVGRE
jgi:hypothetical protein